MSRRITIVGLAALCALALSALSATGASAAETTAYTCVEATTTAEAEFKDPHCKEAGMNVKTETVPFGYKHVSIKKEEKTSLYLNSLGVTTLESDPFLALVKLQSSHVECIECTAENKGTSGAMEVSGSGGKLRFTGVTVANLPTKCKVLSDPGEEEGVILTEQLKFVTTGTNEASISPVTPPVLAHFWIKAITGQKCIIERTYTVEGMVSGTSSGATLNVNDTPLSTTLTVSGAEASIVGEATIEAGAIGSSTHHAAALT